MVREWRFRDVVSRRRRGLEGGMRVLMRVVLPTRGIPRIHDFSSFERIFRRRWTDSAGVISWVCENSDPSRIRGYVGNVFPRYLIHLSIVSFGTISTVNVYSDRTMG